MNYFKLFFFALKCTCVFDNKMIIEECKKETKYGNTRHTFVT